MARILIADDNAEIQQLLTAILNDEGHKVVVASDGKEAIEMILSHAPDILVLDIMMPSIDGYGVLKEMKSAGLRDSVKVLVLTAKTQESDWVRGFKLGADQYLTKPFDVDEFTQAIEGLMGMTKEQLRVSRQEELDRAQLLSRLESIFDH
jgi:DNA-binding response OmpR family regulator